MKRFLLPIVTLLAGYVLADGATFNVKVPEGTLKCYVCGDFNGWDATNAKEMTSSGENLFTLELPDVDASSVAKGYKYLCGQDWLYVEKDAKGDEIDNRTSIGNPDIVASWRSVPEWNVESREVTINGIPRHLRIYLPDGYAESNDTYPVIYYNTVQQRYKNAGEDDGGDYFFGPKSWNAHSSMEKQREKDGKAYIMVQICSMLAENTASHNPEYKGTGASENYLKAFTNELMPYIEKNWRVKQGKENTVIVGADYAALFSIYAAVNRPDLFGTAVVMSPMLWINEGTYETLANKASAGQNYYVSAGSAEPDWMKNDASNLADVLAGIPEVKVSYIEFPGATHNDESWGKCFPEIIEKINNGIHANMSTRAGEVSDDAFRNNTFTLFAGENKSNLEKIGTLEYTDDFRKKGTDTPVAAFVITNDVPVSFKSNYYWNIASSDGQNDTWLLDAPKSVGFSSKKTEVSWQNIAVFENGDIAETTANSNAFKLMAASGTITMTKGSDHLSTATVSFPSSDKTFKIHFGSVNSGSDMGAMTPILSVSDNCIQAEVTYDFHLNKVTVKETFTGDSGNESEPEFSQRVYTLYGGENNGDLKMIGTLTYTDEFRKKGTDLPVDAFVITHDIPVGLQGKYYWNVAKGPDSSSGWVLPAVKDISFSDKKNKTSWHNVALFENGTVEDIAAHSEGFRVIADKETVMMNISSGHISKATVSFPGANKNFQINFGSVNSASDMGAMTPSLSVGEDCIEAEISYDFNLNRVSFVETKHGETIKELQVVSFKAVPAVTVAGESVNLALELSDDCDIELSCKKDFKDNVSITPVRNGLKEYSSALNNLSAGLYTVNVSLIKGNNRLPNVAELTVRVLPQGEAGDKKMVVNAYENIDWNYTERYKSNFHTHTSQSFDTQFTTSEVVDKYSNAGYDILALTDHDANSYPWTMFSLYNEKAEDRDPLTLGMLAIPGNELSKDRRNNWSESTGGEFNHHNDLFTGRKGQEFMSLRESYAYTRAIGGLQIINHPGQYWNLSTEYKNGEKNSPEWHAENFKLYDSLIGLEVYNQGNRRPNDRILWDQVLTLTMPERPVWGYSCDDTHTAEQYFRNYQYMLMPELSVEALKEAMIDGSTVFSYEYTGSGKALAPHINSIDVDEDNKLITIDTEDADKIEWIYSTHRTGSAASTTKSTVVGYGNTFDYNGYQGSYVRARLINDFGETATQPFGFAVEGSTGVSQVGLDKTSSLTLVKNPGDNSATLKCTEPMLRISIVNSDGTIVRYYECNEAMEYTFPISELSAGVYIAVVATPTSAYTAKFIK